MLGVLEYGFDLLACYAWKLFEEVIDPSPALQILEEGLHRHARLLEDPGATYLARHVGRSEGPDCDIANA